MINHKLKAIANLIENCNCIIDVGCDYCWLSILLFDLNKIKFAYNIDINQQPLNQGIKNLSNHNYLSSTINVLNDGLKNLILKQDIDYIIIAGMGTDKIIEILSTSSIKSKYVILQTNNNLIKLRSFLLINYYQILNEVYVYENEHIYVILKVELVSNQQLNINQRELYLGDENKVNDISLWKKYHYINFLKLKSIINFKKDDNQLKTYYEYLNEIFNP